jgi:RNA polymerase sigma-70 factor (ECF subfamily)
VSRAKAQLREARPRQSVPREIHRRLLRAFAHAIEHGDFAAIHAMLSEDATLVGDGGGRVQSFPEPLFGGKRIAQLFYAAFLRYGKGVRLDLVMLNGEWAFLRFIDGKLESAQTFDIEDERIVRIQVQRNPDKLERIAARYGNA